MRCEGMRFECVRCDSVMCGVSCECERCEV